MQSRWHRFILSPFTLPHNPTREFLRVNSKPVTRRNGLAVTNARGILSSGSMAILFFLNTGARARSDDFHRRISERGGRGREGGSVSLDSRARWIMTDDPVGRENTSHPRERPVRLRIEQPEGDASFHAIVFPRRIFSSNAFFFYGHLTTIDAKNRASTCVKIRLIWIG